MVADGKARFGPSPMIQREEARLAMAAGLWSEAEQHWKISADVAPDDWECIEGHVLALIRQRRLEEADARFEDAIARPDAPRDLMKKVMLFSMAYSRLPLTQRVAERILIGAPEDGDAIWAIGVARTSANDLAAAEATLTRGLAVANHPLIPVLAAEVATLRQDWPTAVERWTKLIHQQPHKAWRRLRFLEKSGPSAPWVQLALAQFTGGDATAACETIDLALQRFPEDVPLLLCRARLATLQKQWSSAGSAWNATIVASGGNLPIIEEAFAAAWNLEEHKTVKDAKSLRGVPGPSTGFLAVAPDTLATNEILVQLENAPLDRNSGDCAIEIIRDAHVMPGGPPDQASRRDVYHATGGVFSRTGRLSGLCIQKGFNIDHRPSRLFGPVAGFRSLPGHWLYGAGQVYNHIGHFIMDCIGRLWAAEIAQQTFDGVLYLSKIRAEVSENRMQFTRASRHVNFTRLEHHPFIHPLLEIFSSIRRIHAIVQPTKVESLWVPRQLFGLCQEQMHGNAAFREFVRRKVGAVEAKGLSAARVYVSRSKFASARGALFGESALEGMLARSGYLIFHPEKHSLVEQFALYRDASHIIVSGGSAAHVVALAMCDTQHVAIVGRLPGQSRGFVDQIQAFGAKSSIGIDRLNGVFASCDGAGDVIREPVTRQTHSLDVRSALSDLHANGFLDAVDEDQLRGFSSQNTAADFLISLKEQTPERAWHYVPW